MAMTVGQGGPGADPDVMVDINTTPLIDVLLVLLIMFILTIPVQTHAVKLDTGQGVPPITRPTTNELVVTDDGRLLWNGAPVDLVTLRTYLDQSQTLDSIPELHIRPSAHARYDVVDRVLAVAKRAHVTRMGIVGNDAYACDF